MPNFKILAYLLLGCTDSGGYVKFTPKYIIVGVKSVLKFQLGLWLRLTNKITFSGAFFGIFGQQNRKR
jgi:hypothetical protein